MEDNYAQSSVVKSNLLILMNFGQIVVNKVFFSWQVYLVSRPRDGLNSMTHTHSWRKGTFIKYFVTEALAKMFRWINRYVVFGSVELLLNTFLLQRFSNLEKL